MSHSTLKISYENQRFLSVGIIIFNRSNDDFLHQLPSTAQTHVKVSSSNNSAKKNLSF